MRRALSLFLAGALAAAPVAAAESARLPDAVQLLDAAYRGPSFSYQGRVLLTQWNGDVKKAEEVNVYFAPPGRYRLEFLTPDGAIERIVLGDQKREQVQIVESGKVVATYVTEVAPRLLANEDEQRLLLDNYAVSVTGTENVMGRPAWVLDFVPGVPGKPAQKMWIDRESSAVLEVRRNLAGAGASSQFTRFEKRALPDDMFGQSAPVATQEILKPSENQQEIQKMAREAGNRERLDGGFALMGADLFDVRGEKVRHLRYTDGLIPVSMFVTRVPVEAPRISDAVARPSSSPLYFGLSTPVNVSQWKDGREHFTLIGEVEPGLLQRMSAGTQTN